MSLEFPMEGDAAPQPFTDLGNARRLVEKHRKEIRYVSDIGKWIVWDGIRWKLDGDGEIIRRAKKTVEAMLDEEDAELTLGRNYDLERHAKKSQSKRSLDAMVDLAKSELEISITSDRLDSNRFLLNCANGTVNLNTGHLQPHNAKDLITKLAPVKFDPNALSDVWISFLNTVTNHDRKYGFFLRRSVGYWLTGSTDEEKLFFVYGTAGTGKSTFLESIKAILGDYAATADFESFVKRDGTSGPRNDIARLAGKRLVLSSEIDEGKRLAEALIKSLTGNDTITARLLFKEHFEFRPQFKLVMCANHRPLVKHDDEGIWRRILTLPFENQIPEKERDPEIKRILCDPEVSGPAILAWAVKGAMKWLESGLNIPVAVTRATETYRSEMDPLADFLNECCITEKGAWVPTVLLYATYKEWAERNGEKYKLNEKTFREQIRERGFELGKCKSGTVRCWKGIGIIMDTTDVP